MSKSTQVLKLSVKEANLDGTTAIVSSTSDIEVREPNNPDVSARLPDDSEGPYQTVCTRRCTVTAL